LSLRRKEAIEQLLKCDEYEFLENAFLFQLMNFT